MNAFEEEIKKGNKDFAHRCVKLASELETSKLGSHISGQLIRCSTSVAANYQAACIAQSKKSFITKSGIVIEEADEFDFWLEFILDENIQANRNETRELTKMFIPSPITMSGNLETV